MSEPQLKTNCDEGDRARFVGWRFRFAHLALAVSMLVMGACGMIYEYTLGVLGNNLMGSSREQIFVVIGLMMFAMGIGAALQRLFVHRLIDRFLQLELLLGLLGGVSALAIFATFVFTDSYRLVMYVFSLAIGVLIGCEVPLLIRINTQYTKNLRTNLSAVLCMDYVGSLVGALLFAYVLLTQLSLDRISLLLGCVNVLLALAGLIYFWPLIHRRSLLALGCAASIVLLATGLVQSEGWMARLEQRCFQDPIVYIETTPYQHLVLTKRRDRTRLYIDGHLQLSSDDEAIYHELLVHVPMHVADCRDRVLILGGGDGLALREVLRYGDVKEVVLVDIDPSMIRLASEHPDLIQLNQGAFHDARVHATTANGIGSGDLVTVRRPTKRDPLVDQTSYQLAEVHVYTVDADLFIRDVTGAFDAVIVDFPDPRSIELAKLFSVEFYRTLARRMVPGSVVAIQSTSPWQARRAFQCIGLTLRSAGFRVLPYHGHVPSFGDWGWHLAWLGTTSEAKMRQRFRSRSPLLVDTRYVTPEVIDSAFVFGKDLSTLDEEILPNTKLRPVIVQYHAKWKL